MFWTDITSARRSPGHIIFLNMNSTTNTFFVIYLDKFQNQTLCYKRSSTCSSCSFLSSTSRFWQLKPTEPTPPQNIEHRLFCCTPTPRPIFTSGLLEPFIIATTAFSSRDPKLTFLGMRLVMKHSRGCVGAKIFVITCKSSHPTQSPRLFPCILNIRNIKHK